MTADRRQTRALARGFSLVELAAGVALAGSLVAIAVPTFLREVKSSRLVEPTEGLNAISAGAIAYATTHGGKTSLALAFPRSVGLTPPAPPRARLVADPPGTWSDSTWTALQFPVAGSGFAFADGDPHAFAFAFDSTPSIAPASGGTAGPGKSTFVAHAHGDLDGDGAMSTFEVRGQDTASEGPVILPGMYVEAELE